MCRSIKILFNFDPPATNEEIEAAALQFVRKVSGTTKPSKVNQAAFDTAVSEISASVARLLDSLSTIAPPRNREVETEKATVRARTRFGR
jgi:hypothetical protein